MKRTRVKAFKTSRKAYVEALAKKKALEEAKERMELAYIKANGIVNADGKEPVCGYAIEDDSTFERMLEVIGTGIDALEIPAARKALYLAEESLITTSLDLMLLRHPGIRATLMRASMRSASGFVPNITTRIKCIETAMEIDAKVIAGIPA